LFSFAHGHGDASMSRTLFFFSEMVGDFRKKLGSGRR
jgi:hypothetical protein